MVDAGGKGFVVILEGMLSVIKDGKMIESQSAEVSSPAAEKRNAAGSTEADITYTYCTEFIVKRAADCAEPAALRAYLSKP